MSRVARPRVIITSPDSNVTVKLIASLNPKRYRLEHIHDSSEALLRAEFVLAHAVVAHIDELTVTTKKRLESALNHGVAIVIVSATDAVAKEAAAMGAHLLRAPFGVQDVKRKVLDAVSEAHTQRSGDANVVSRRDSRPQAQRVVLMVGERDAAEIMAALLRAQLNVSCEAAHTAGDAENQLARGIDCLVARPALLLGSEDGAKLARKLARRGVAVVPLNANEELDAASAGQVAWSILPQVRRSLQARERLTRARTPE